jgi:hypothetical protein
MIYCDDDIDFTRLSGKRFEELCFDILARLGYYDLVWRQGGADNGRNIEGCLDVNNSLVGSYAEKWFFECKNHQAGINVRDISDKIDWAKAEQADHFVLFSSSYLTNNAMTWLEKTKDRCTFNIHVITDKNLKNLILRYSDIQGSHYW